MELISLQDLQKEFNVTCVDGIALLKRGRHIAKIKLPLKATPELASLFGYVLGDGHVKKNKVQFCYVNKSKDLVEHITSCVKQTFDIEPAINFSEKYQLYFVYSPTVVARILIMLGAPVSRKTIQKIMLPDWVTKGSQEVKRAFIRALFDDEGWVGITQGSFAIGFGQNKRRDLIESHKKYLEQIRHIIQEIGIQPSEIFQKSEKENFIQLGFKIVGRENIKNFLDEVGFNHKLKQEKLLRIINGYKQIQYNKREAKLKVLDALKNGPLRSGHLGVLLNRDQKTIWKHLHKLVQRDLVIKIGTKNNVLWGLKNNINPDNKI